MGAASTLTYGGIQIGYIKTNVFKQEPIYDSSHTDLLYQKITLSVSGVISYCGQAAGKLPIPSATLNGGSPTYGCASPQEIVAIRQKMLTPRGTLVYTVDGVELIRSPVPGKAGRDEANGPKPIRFDIVKIDGGKTLFVEFEVETFINECNMGSCSQNTQYKQVGSNQVLSNRFTIVDSFDTNYLHTRTITGTLVLSGVNAPLNAEWAAYVAALTFLPTIPEGWKRDSISLTQEKDTLTYQYTIVDKQLQYAMPGKAVSIDAQYTQTFGILGAGAVENEMSVTIQGEPDADYQGLLKIASRIIFSRIHPDALKNTPRDPDFGTEIIMGGTITEDIFNRRISFKIKTKRMPAETFTPDGLNVLTHRLGSRLQVDDIVKNKNRQPHNYRTYMLACALGDPCSGRQVSSPSSTNPQKPKEKSPEIKVYPPEVTKDYPTQTKFSPGQTKAGYGPDSRNGFSVETNYHTFQMSVAAPGAPAQFATVGAPTTIKKVRQISTRTGAPPEVPHPETNDVLLHTWVYPYSPVLQEDGVTWLYTLSIEYWYGVGVAYNYGTIELPRNPMYTGKFGEAQNLVLADQFKRDILQKYA